MADDTTNEDTYSSYLWYTAVWYIAEFLLILGFRFLTKGKLDKQSAQRSATDTLLLTLVFMLLQWSRNLLTQAFYRLPYVLIHLCLDLIFDLIPTLIWLIASELVLLFSLAIAQQIYHNLATDGKVNVSSIKDNLSMKYLKSISSSQKRIEHAISEHIRITFPRLMDKTQQAKESPPLCVLFGVINYLLQLSTLSLVLLDTVVKTGKSCYHRATSKKKVGDLRPALIEISQLTLTTLICTTVIQFHSVSAVMSEGAQFLKASADKKFKKSISSKSGPSAVSNDDCNESMNVSDDFIPNGNSKDKQHAD